MKKQFISHYVEKLGDFSDFVAKNAGKFLDESGKSVLDSASGVGGIILKLFTKPLLDKYFEKVKDKKLEDFGYYTYLKCSIKQAIESLEHISVNNDIPFANDDVMKIINTSLSADRIDNSNMVLVFVPTKHPIVVFIRQAYQHMLEAFYLGQDTINEFLKYFNKNIDNQIKIGFGEEYESHLEDVRKNWLRENEESFLLRMQELNFIGFSENDKFNYETTYAKWKKVSRLRCNEYEDDKIDNINHTLKKISDIEKEYVPIENLIDQYFASGESSYVDKNLFIIADFGKGKSVFLKHYASELATKYMQTGEGLFPVYFNLRNYKEYSQESRLGVIYNYLLKKDRIDLNDEYFKSKEYVFLIDSLDESGELNARNLDEVIASINKIQYLDPVKCFKNRIIITSRPIEEGLTSHLYKHSPFIKKNDEGGDIEYFISIYGFKMEQFNDWLINALRAKSELSSINVAGYVKTMIEAIKSNENINLYKLFLENKVLSPSELRRPIFAYMIYQLTVNKVDFSKTGKIGVYLSFLNLLTKEAKHINDRNYKINMKEEFEFRNILHSIAALWAYKRHKGGQGTLSKVDICRTIEGNNITDNTSELFERYKGVRDFQFLSHSYFGEDGECLYFQHQSFAEILLAEYYLKVLIKYATDSISSVNIEQARLKLMLGEPTGQTIEFLIELLQLLKESAIESGDEHIIEKRKLLFPLMASLGTKKNNNFLYSGYIDNRWYDSDAFSENETKLPEEKLKNWVIKQKEINKIIELCKAILNSNTTYVLERTQNKNSLYNYEVSECKKSLNNINSDMDKWLALLAGNILVNNEQEKQFFNKDLENYDSLFNMIKGWNYVNGSSCPSWGKDIFIGIDLSNNDKLINLNHVNFSQINFSFSYLKNLSLSQCSFTNCIFNSVTFENIDFSGSDFSRTVFKNIISIIGFLDISLCILEQGLFMPGKLCNILNQGDRAKLVNFGIDVVAFGGNIPFLTDDLEDILDTLDGFILYVVENKGVNIDEIKTWFKLYNENGNPIKSNEKSFIKLWSKFDEIIASKLELVSSK